LNYAAPGAIFAKQTHGRESKPADTESAKAKVMKRILIGPFFYLLTASLPAQIHYPPAVMANQDQWSPALKQAWVAQNAGKYPSGGRVETKMLTEDLQLDSTISYQPTDVGGGNIILTPFERTDYLYVNPTTLIERESIREDNKWKKSFQSTLKLDDQDRIFAILSESVDPDVGFLIPVIRFRIFYHGNSATEGDSIFFETWSAEAQSWIRMLTVFNTFNELDLVSESISIILDSEGEQETSKDIYYYDDQARNTRIESFLLDGENEIPTFMEENTWIFEYLSSTTTSISDGAGGFFPLTKTDYGYTAQGNPDTVETFQYLALNATWTLTDAHYQQYDAENRLTSEELLQFEVGVPVEHQIITYDYLQDDYLAWKSVFYVDQTSGLQTLDHKTQYHYSSLSTSVNQEGAKYDPLFLYPNPTRDQVEFTASSASWIRVFNIGGQLIQTIQVPEGKNSIDLTAMVPGFYTLILQDKSAVYAGRILKQ
jgi:hypothetical protein